LEAKSERLRKIGNEPMGLQNMFKMITNDLEAKLTDKLI
jgi:hypothetical protein